MNVIDISAWQEKVDWKALKEAGVQGVILKIGERNNLDSMFIEHVNNAVNNGFKYGVYYFSHATTREESIEEADTVAYWLETYLRGETPELGIWFDAEAAEMRYCDTTDICMTFLNQLTNHGHQYQGIYASWNWLSSEGAHYIKLEELPDYVPIWVAQYGSGNTFETAGKDYLKEEYPNKIIRIHQFTDNLKGFGYDANIYYED